MNETVDPARYIVGLGHPRCGTGFAANLLNAGGLDIGHERRGADGMVSWMAVTGRRRVPWGEALGPLDAYSRRLCIVRSPVGAIPSIVAENGKKRSLRFRARILAAQGEGQGEGQAAGGLPETVAEAAAAPVENAVRSYTGWYELILARAPALVFRVDRPEDDPALAGFAGVPIDRDAGIERNSRPHLKRSGFGAEDLDRLPCDLRDRFLALAERLGYPDVAAELRGD